MTTYTRNTLSGSLAPVNNELEKIEVSLREKLDRNPSVAQNNEMLDDLDMNSNRIINYPDAVNDSDLITKGQVASLAPVQSVNGATGNVVVATNIQIDTNAIFDNIAEMKTADLEVGNYVKCKRYYALGDLVNGLEFEVVAGGTGVDDGGSFHDLANGNQAQLISSGAVNVKQFGAVGDGVADDTLFLQSAISSVTEGEIRIPSGTYIVTSQLTLTRYKSLIGEGVTATILKSQGIVPCILKMSGVGSSAFRSFQRVSGISIDGVDRSGYGLWISSNANYTVQDVRIQNCTWGLWNDSSLISSFNRVTLNKCDTGIVLGASTAEFNAPNNVVSFSDCSVNACITAIGTSDDSVLFGFGNQVSFNSCVIENNCIDADNIPIPAGIAVNLIGDGGQGVFPTITFTNCWFESNKGARDIVFNNLTANPRSLVIRDTAFIGGSTGVNCHVQVINNAGGNMKFVLDGCAMTSAPTVGDATSVIIDGLDVVGVCINTTLANFTNTSLNWQYYDSRNRAIFRQEYRGNGNGVSFRGTSGTFDATLSMVGNQLQLNSQDDIRIDTGSDGYLWHFDNLLRLGNFYLWFDASGDLRTASAQPTDKNADGVVVGTQV